jgi:carbonic anhydrase
MNERRHFLGAAGALAATALAPSASRGATPPADTAAAQACLTFDAARQAQVTPDEALAMLKAGNERFVSGNLVRCDLRAQVKATADGQAPFAAVVGCIDSRVPPEMVFDQRVGDIFAARIAGNFVNTDIIGSLEFATAAAGARLIVVLGHTECGAIKGAVDDVKLGNLTATLANIRPSLAKLNYGGVPSSKNKELVQKVADQNAKDAAAMLLSRSEVLSGLVKDGKLKIVSAMHDIGTGKISWFA